MSKWFKPGTTPPTWRVGVFVSSSSPSLHCLVLAVGPEIDTWEKHRDFIRWLSPDPHGVPATLPAEDDAVAWRWSENDGQSWFDWRTDFSHYERAKKMGCRIELAFPHGVATTVPVNRPATLEEAQHAAQIGACLPNGVMFDAFGRERVRYVRVIHDGTTCVVPPGDVADMVDSEQPDDYRTEDVYLSKEEFDALPEFDGF